MRDPDTGRNADDDTGRNTDTITDGHSGGDDDAVQFTDLYG